jgi:hypothetical protein
VPVQVPEISVMQQITKELQMLMVAHLIMMGQQTLDESFRHNFGKKKPLSDVIGRHSLNMSAARAHQEVILWLITINFFHENLDIEYTW